MAGKPEVEERLTARFGVQAQEVSQLRVGGAEGATFDRGPAASFSLRWCSSMPTWPAVESGVSSFQ
ncbi:MAG: hypothetical protein QXF69_09360 [Thermofilaceae archaeon]